ncbi:MAG: hypothetical protein ACOX6N_05080 [Patescibacteria group bacterium]|jgi:hypothetical protein
MKTRTLALTFTYIFLFLYLSLDIVIYPFFTAAKLIDANFLVLIFMTLAIPLRLFSKKPLFHPFLPKINQTIFPLILTLNVLLMVINKLTHDTFILTHLHVHPDNIIFLSGLSGFLYLLYPHSKSTTRNQLIIRLLGPALLLFTTYFYLFSRPLFELITQEDGLYETIQFLLYIAASYNFFKAFQSIDKSKYHILAKFSLFVFSIAVLFVALEEISWGQRLIGFATPEKMMEKNTQKEFTVHNLSAFQIYLHQAYMILGLAGTFGYITIKKISKKILKKIKPLLPPPNLVFYFFSVTVYYVSHDHVRRFYDFFTGNLVFYNPWQEVAELFLSFGIFFFSLKSREVVRPKVN